jgi:hypothetical protein
MASLILLCVLRVSARAKEGDPDLIVGLTPSIPAINLARQDNFPKVSRQSGDN